MSIGQSYFTRAWLVTDDDIRFHVTLEWNDRFVLDARRQVQIPPWEDSTYQRIELPSRAFVDCPQMIAALRDLDWQVLERRTAVADPSLRVESA